MKDVVHEINFDGLVGPTHNYAGLSYGNVASQTNAGRSSSPKQAAKQGLNKMRILMELGIPQAVIPPQQRPNFELLRTCGFQGSEINLLQQAYRYQPELLAACYSASSMWTANMATVSPSCNTKDHKLNITPANLTYTLHRAQEAQFNYTLLKTIFADQRHFNVHQPLPAFRDLSDEGAANHSLLCTEYGAPGLELYVYGRLGLDDKVQTARYPARQTKLASSSIMRQHGLEEHGYLLAQQNPAVIDAGVFHNDVIFVANKNVMFYHSEAFYDDQHVKRDLAKFFAGDCHFLEVTDEQLSIEESIATYIFNSQLVSTSETEMALIVPMECKESKAASAVLERILQEKNPITQVIPVECRESMQNGGGPACLRLRVQATAAEMQAMQQGVFLDAKLYQRLDLWIDKHYREQLQAQDLLDPQLFTEVYAALDELTQILQLGSIYPFQQA